MYNPEPLRIIKTPRAWAVATLSRLRNNVNRILQSKKILNYEGLSLAARNHDSYVHSSLAPS